MELVAFDCYCRRLWNVRSVRAGCTGDIESKPSSGGEARLIPPQALYGPPTTAVHSLEFSGSADVDGLRRAQGANAPSATRRPRLPSLRAEPRSRALGIVEESVARVGGRDGAGLYPCETFELL